MFYLADNMAAPSEAHDRFYPNMLCSPIHYNSFEVTNVNCAITYVNQKFTREIQNRWRPLVSLGLTLQGIFLNFQEQTNQHSLFGTRLLLEHYNVQFESGILIPMV